MDVSTRFAEAIPIKKINAKCIMDCLLPFFARFGLPREVQTDQGTNFMSNTFQQSLYQLGIKQFRSSAYHPESQGALERYHQTLKTMIRKYCMDTQEEWDKGIHFLMFALRDMSNESLGFSPFELLFGHQVRGPLKLLKDDLLNEKCDDNILDYVSNFKERLYKTWEVAKENLKVSQHNMKASYDKKAKIRSFKAGDQVLILLPISGQPLKAKYSGPYVIEKKINDVNYIIATPDRKRNKRLCHINMMKEYYNRNAPVMICNIKVNDVSNEYDKCEEFSPLEFPPLKNSEVINDLEMKLSHLSDSEKKDMYNLIDNFSPLFKDTPGRTSLSYHDIEVGDASPIKQHPYRLHPDKLNLVRKEIDYMLKNDLIEPVNNDWSSPIVVVKKSDNNIRLCIDYRKVNKITKSDTYPIPRIDDCIDRIGNAKYVSKYDLLKGYWQVPMTERAKEISTFVTPDGLYACKVMPFGCKNAPATFQRLMNIITNDLEGCVVYIDDVVIYSNTWDEHVGRTKEFFYRLKQAGLTVNLVKSEIGQAQVTYLGYVVGQGKILPRLAKVQAIFDFPVPINKKQVMRFLGMAGYYRKFVENFSTIVCPLTNLLSKNIKFEWTNNCNSSFNHLKSILICEPVLIAPDFSKPFKLAVDASDVGAGAVLLQDKDDLEHPVCYYSKKFNKYQRGYSTIEKELFALILALQHFEAYVTTGIPLCVYTDHNPLTFLNKFKNKNQRLTRWSLFLQEYNINIHHIKGKDNVIADALSRIE